MPFFFFFLIDSVAENSVKNETLQQQMSFHCSAEAGSSRSTPSEDVRNIKNYCKQKTPKAFSGSICGPMEWELKAADGASLHQNQEIYPCTHTLWTLTWIKARV